MVEYKRNKNTCCILINLFPGVNNSDLVNRLFGAITVNISMPDAVKKGKGNATNKL